MFSDFDWCYSGINETGGVVLRPAFRAAIDRALKELSRTRGHALDAAAADADDEIAEARCRFRWHRNMARASDAEIDFLMHLEKLSEACRGRDSRCDRYK